MSLVFSVFSHTNTLTYTIMLFCRAARIEQMTAEITSLQLAVETHSGQASAAQANVQSLSEVQTMTEKKVHVGTCTLIVFLPHPTVVDIWQTFLRNSLNGFV